MSLACSRCFTKLIALGELFASAPRLSGGTVGLWSGTMAPIFARFTVDSTIFIQAGDGIELRAEGAVISFGPVPNISLQLGADRVIVHLMELERAQRMADDLAQVAQDLQDILDDIQENDAAVAVELADKIERRKG